MRPAMIGWRSLRACRSLRAAVASIRAGWSCLAALLRNSDPIEVQCFQGLCKRRSGPLPHDPIHNQPIAPLKLPHSGFGLRPIDSILYQRWRAALASTPSDDELPTIAFQRFVTPSAPVAMRGSSLLNMAQPVGNEAFPCLIDPFHAQSGSGAVSK